MTERVEIGGLRIAKCLYELVERRVAPGTGIDADAVWTALGQIVRDLAPHNRALLDERDAIQARVDAWHHAHRGQPLDVAEHEAFLREIGYLQPEVDDYELATADVDPEVAEVAGPQLVVPVDNARYALNAANARWGSLYDALYGSDAIAEDGGAERGGAYNPVRGARVVAAASEFLDEAVGLAEGRHGDVAGYALEAIDGRLTLVASLEDGRRIGLADPDKLVGYRRRGSGDLEVLALRNNGLHLEFRFDRSSPVGSAHAAGLSDVILEAAITTIQDCEDSVAAVDAEDKARVYRQLARHHAGHPAGHEFDKGGRQITRKPEPRSRPTPDPDGARPHRCPGGACCWCATSASTCTPTRCHRRRRRGDPRGLPRRHGHRARRGPRPRRRGRRCRNSRAGSVYIVKPKLHGPAEVAATVALFARVEQALGLAPQHLKIGIMDEERRTTVNLKEACIRAARERSSSSTPASSIAPATRSTPTWRPAR